MTELLRDSKGDLLRARTYSATSIHTPKPEDPSVTLCGGRVMLTSEFMCAGSAQLCDHDTPALHVADLTVCAGENPQLCKRCQRSVAKRLREAEDSALGHDRG